jgi:Protein of unknown function (DUF2914)
VNHSSSAFHTIKHTLSHHWLTVAFVAGFITDFLLLDKIDDAFDNAVLFMYVVLATLSLVLFYVSVAERGPGWLVRFLSWITPITMQYAFGGLLSGMLIFYGRSGDLIASAPFLLLIMGVIIANELVKKRSERLLYNVSLYFIGVFSYTVLIVPVWLGKMGDLVFIGSGLLAVAVTMFLIKLLKFIVPNFLTMQKRFLVFVVGCIYVLFNAFYFLNLIPPIPLSLTKLGIYQSVERSADGNYRLTMEKRSWYENLPWYPITIRPIPGQGVSCFARVYAPTDLATTILHRWAKEDENGHWEERSPISYQISGGNENGYRGFTAIANLSPGKWRCSVENERGQVLGRRTFTIVTSTPPGELVTAIE